MSLKIAFCAGPAKLTDLFLIHFLKDNYEQVAKLNLRSGRALLTDGTEIIAIYDRHSIHGQHFDQILLAGDHRAHVEDIVGADLIREIDRHTYETNVPREFRWLYYVRQLRRTRKMKTINMMVSGKIN